MAKLSRVTFTLPPSLVADLAFVSERVGVSRSAIVSDVLGQPLADLRRLLEAFPPSPSPADVLRLRGDSEALIEARLSELRAALGGSRQ